MGSENWRESGRDWRQLGSGDFALSLPLARLAEGSHQSCNARYGKTLPTGPVTQRRVRKHVKHATRPFIFTLVVTSSALTGRMNCWCCADLLSTRTFSMIRKAFCFSFPHFFFSSFMWCLFLNSSQNSRFQWARDTATCHTSSNLFQRIWNKFFKKKKRKGLSSANTNKRYLGR